MISTTVKEAAKALGQYERTEISVAPWGRSEYVFLRCGLVVRVSDHPCNPRTDQIEISPWADLATAERQIAMAIARQRRHCKKARAMAMAKRQRKVQLARQLLDALQQHGEHPLTDAQRRRFENSARDLGVAAGEAIEIARTAGRHAKCAVAKKIAIALAAGDEEITRLCREIVL